MPFALTGWMWLLNYNILVAVGFIALAGRHPEVNDIYEAVLEDDVPNGCVQK